MHSQELLHCYISNFLRVILSDSPTREADNFRAILAFPSAGPHDCMQGVLVQIYRCLPYYSPIRAAQDTAIHPRSCNDSHVAR